MSAKGIGDQERRLWGEYFRRMHLIADRFNTKYWPALKVSKAQLELDRADYIATFCFVFELLRSRIEAQEGVTK